MADELLVLAPRGRDASVIEGVLRRVGVGALVCADIACVLAALQSDPGGLVATEEALAGPELEALLGWCDRQPPWSDLPVIVLATRQAGPRSSNATGVLERLGNVVLVERPVNAETLASTGRSALRARRRQYQARALLLEREENERTLRDWNDTLERRVEERARALEDADERLAFALDAAGMGLWDLDLLAGTSRRTPQHDRIFGYLEPQQSWDFERFIGHVVEDDREVVARAFASAAGRGQLDFACRVRRPDGVVRWVAVKGRVSAEENGRPLRMAGVVMDITERRSTEDALHQAQKMEAIGQLTGGVAHDFNNLLTVVVGGLELIGRKPEQTDRVLRLAEAALTAAKRGEQLTKQLLAFSRRQTLRPRTLNPNRLLLEFESLAQRAVGEAVTLRMRLDPEAGPVTVDASQFEAAVLNLIVNARDAMAAVGEIVVTSRNLTGAVGELPRGDYVAVGVSDTGTGLDAEALARAFEPFFTTKDVGKGSGLGLSQVYGFARSAGGDVTIESEVGRGTTVTLFFPRSARPVVDDEPSGSELPPGVGLEGQTVLLVEDDEQVLAMAVESLAELGCRVLVARNASEALERIGGPDPIDLMFSDVVMPGGMDGAQLAVEARRVRPKLKVLLTSGYVGMARVNGAAGDFPILNKPYRRSELAEKIRLVLD